MVLGASSGSWLTYCAVYVLDQRLPHETCNGSEESSSDRRAYNMIVGYAIPSSALWSAGSYRGNIHVSCVADERFDIGQPSCTCARVCIEFRFAYLIRQRLGLGRIKHLII